MVGENTVLACRVSLECGGHSFVGCVDARVWTSVLLGDLSVGRVSGYRVLV